MIRTYLVIITDRHPVLYLEGHDHVRDLSVHLADFLADSHRIWESPADLYAKFRRRLPSENEATLHTDTGSYEENMSIGDQIITADFSQKKILLEVDGKEELWVEHSYEKFLECAAALDRANLLARFRGATQELGAAGVTSFSFTSYQDDAYYINGPDFFAGLQPVERNNHVFTKNFLERVIESRTGVFRVDTYAASLTQTGRSWMSEPELRTEAIDAVPIL